MTDTGFLILALILLAFLIGQGAIGFVAMLARFGLWAFFVLALAIVIVLQNV